MDIRRKKLHFRSWHRGTKELDLILGCFADCFLKDMSEQELDIYEEILACEDTELIAWIEGATKPPENKNTPLLQRLLHLNHMQQHQDEYDTS
ncbi:MAG: succinate dehydrogenase assembly factor 2 [Parvibaculales bacterium]